MQSTSSSCHRSPEASSLTSHEGVEADVLAAADAALATNRTAHLVVQGHQRVDAISNMLPDLPWRHPLRPTAVLTDNVDRPELRQFGPTDFLGEC